MGVAGELQSDARLLHLGQVAGHMVEQNVCPAGGQMDAVQHDAQPERMAGVAVGNAHNVEAVDGDFFIGEDADAGAREDLGVERGVAILVMVAG